MTQGFDYDARMRFVLVVIVISLVGVARAEVKQAAGDGMSLAITQHVDAPPSKVFAALGEIGKWWDPAHSYSHDGANLSLKTEAGACFCERWKDGSVEHGRVLVAMRDQMLRIAGALGPLQSKTVDAILTFALKPDAKGTVVSVTYRVGGNATTALDKDAAAVDAVLSQQVTRLKRYVEAPAPPTPATR